MKFLRKLDSHLLTFLIVLAIGIVGFASTSFLLNSKYIDIPLGFALSGALISLTYVMSHFFLVIDKRKGTSTFAIVAITLRLVIVLTSLLLLFLMYYRWQIKLFNVFVYVGVYTAAVIAFLLINALNKGKE